MFSLKTKKKDILKAFIFFDDHVDQYIHEDIDFATNNLASS